MTKLERKRCAIYTRKSSEEGLEQDFNSLAAQREACEAYIASQRSEGWKALPDHYDDGGFSGGNLDRPALVRLLEAVDAGTVDVVVVYKVDRLTRSLADFAKLIDRFDAHRVSVVAVTQPFNTTTSMGRLTLNVLLSFAQFEREITGERIRDKIAASKRKGMWMGGCVPLGYDVKERQLIVNEAEAETVRHIFHRYLALGSIYRLQSELHRDGIRSKKRIRKDGSVYGNAQFSRGALYPLLRNRIYLGEITHQGETHAGLHDGIIDRELFDAVQARLQTNSRRHKHRPAPVSILAGKLFDDKGVRLYPAGTHKKGKSYRYYVSKAVMNGGGSRVRARWPAESLEQFLREQIANWLEETGHGRRGQASPSIELAEQAADAKQRILKRPHGDELLRSLIESAELSNHQVTIRLHPPALAQHLSAVNPDELELTWVADLTMHSRHRGKREIFAPYAVEPDPVLVGALTLAHDWNAKLVSGSYSTQHELAQAVGRSSRDIKRLLNLCYLDPALKRAILEGRQSEETTLKNLIRSGTLPIEFAEQRRRWPIPAGSRR